MCGVLVRRNLFKVRMRLGHFDPPGPLQQISPSDICSNESIAVSMEGPRQSAALLKNVNKALPLSAATAGSVFVVGPNANLSKSDAGYYGPGNPCGSLFWNMVDAGERAAALRGPVHLHLPTLPLSRSLKPEGAFPRSLAFPLAAVPPPSHYLRTTTQCPSTPRP